MSVAMPGGRTPILRMVAWAASLGLAAGLGFWLGRGWDGSGSPAADGAVPDDRASPDAVPDSAESLAVARALGVAPAGAADLARFSRASEDALSNALRIADPEVRAGRLRALLQVLDLEGIPRAIRFAEQLGPSPQTRQFRRMLLRRWGELNPRSAIAFATGNADGWNDPELVAATLAGWSAVDPRSAWSWARENPSGRGFGDAHLAAVVAATTPGDPGLAYDFISDPAIAPEVGFDLLRNWVSTAWVAGHGGFVLEQVEALEPGIGRMIAATEAARLFARDEPAKAAAWASLQDDPRLRQQAIVAAVGEWAASQPENAAEWALGMEDPQIRSEAIATAVSGWVQRGELPAAGDWLNQFEPSPDLDRASQNLAMALAGTDPEAAATWAEGIVNPVLREATFNLVDPSNPASRFSGRADANAVYFQAAPADGGAAWTGAFPVEAMGSLGPAITMRQGEAIEVIVDPEGQADPEVDPEWDVQNPPDLEDGEPVGP